MSVELFKPYKIGKLELKNRFMRSATWDGTASPSGEVTDESVAIYRKLSKGSIGLIVTGYAFVSRQGQSSHRQYGIYSADMIPGLRRLTRVAHEQEGKIALQIVHGGFNSNFLISKGNQVVAVSKKDDDSRLHREMTDEDIENTIEDFAKAAQWAVDAGFDAVQLHGAHGFLLNQFLSPLFNYRNDKWGGTAENRRRFNLEVIRRIRRAIGTDFPLLIKYGIADDREGGLSLSEGIETAKAMIEAGIDSIEVSAGIGMNNQVNKDGEIVPFRDRAAALKRAVSVPVALVSGIRTLETSHDIVDSGDADLISMSRPFIREPDLINRWQTDHKAALCISCGQCHGILHKGEPLECGEERRLREALP
jgi:2,4-dienoyl-CoA reductase-like NADH-dependent reductase (Old Yellow Enzyme family)